MPALHTLLWVIQGHATPWPQQCEHQPLVDLARPGGPVHIQDGSLGQAWPFSAAAAVETQVRGLL